MNALVPLAICVTLCALHPDAAWADGPGAFKRAPGLPEAEAQALEAYNAGVQEIQRADRQGPQQAQAASQAYLAALRRFEDAARVDPNLYEAHTYIGYANRKLGQYKRALKAYETALQLKPDFAPAIEYQGEAYLGLDRVEEAKGNYFRLYATAPDQADKLLKAMEEWVARRREDGGGVNAETLDGMAEWVARARQSHLSAQGDGGTSW